MAYAPDEPAASDSPGPAQQRRAPRAAFDLQANRTVQTALVGVIAGAVCGAPPAFCIGLGPTSLTLPLTIWLCGIALGALIGALVTDMRQIVRVEFTGDRIVLRDLGGMTHLLRPDDVLTVVQRHPIARTGSPRGWDLSLHGPDTSARPFVLSAGRRTQELEMAVRDFAGGAVIVATFGAWQMPPRPAIAVVREALAYEGWWHRRRALLASAVLAPIVLTPLLAGGIGLRQLMDGRVSGATSVFLGASSLFAVVAVAGFIISDWRWKQNTEKKLAWLVGEMTQCHRCGYSTAGLPGGAPCPECGAPRASR